MTLRTWGTSLLLSLLCVQVSAAQVRQISGRITNSQTEQGVPDATVAVLGTQIVAQADDNGRFVLNAPDGPANLMVRNIGYKRQQITVPPGQATVNVALEPDVFKLEEIVITGQATGVEQRNLANAVSTVSAAELTRAPAPTIESALQGKIAGATIQANSGAPGGGLQVNLRGVSTIIGDLEPLYVIDGVAASDVAIPNGANAVTQAQAGGNPRNQDNAVNRIADLNPEDIEKIEVLKGGSAAAIYGSKATNGVVFITTKRGQVGKPQFNMTQRFGMTERANQLGSRTFPTLGDALAVFTDTALVTSLYQQGRTFDFENEIFGHKPLSYETDASVSGGTENTKYYVSALVKDDGGIATNTGYKKQSLRSNLDQELGGGFQMQVNVSGTHSLSQRGLSNNDNSGTSPFLVFPFTPNFVDLLPTGGSDSLPSDFPNNPFERSNPLQTFQFLKNDEDVWRLLGTSTLRWSALRSAKSHLQFIGTGGVDYFQQDNNFVSPPELQFEPNDGQPGTVVLSKSSNRNLSLTLNATHTFLPGDPEHGTQWTTSAGVQAEERRLFATQILGRTLLTGQTSPQQAASQTVLSRLEPVRDLGLFGQEEVLLADRRLLLTAGLRADRSSANGNPSKYFFYPKFAASYLFQRPIGGIDELKFRAAYGQTGNRAAFGALFSPDTSGTIGGSSGTSIGTRAGDPNLRPERQKEFEGGFDATLANGRAQLNFTIYQKSISDLLLERTLAPSTGQENQIFSSNSALRNRGLEAALTVQPVQSKNVNWVVRTTFFANKSKITALAVPTYQTGGFALSLGTFQIQKDSSPTQIFGLVGVDGSGNPIAGKVGDASPDFQMSFSSDVDLYRFTLGMLWDYKQGGDIINLTEFLYDAGQNSVDFTDPGGGADRIARFGQGFTQPYVQSGTYVKLRELNLSYNLPERLTSSLFGRRIRNARLSLTGRNLLRFTPYRGLDPEVSNFGRQAIVRNIDVAPFPPSRSFFLSIDLGF
ncbi:MAG: TonB-dependent starch-binding outer membrane protein SusC [Gemmatimonadales bacterium]|nr:TonB-dependent starch-binding outer membrane protein SusC [Gemmatimonadales bacterium]